MINETHNPLTLSLDFQNPRFSLFSFSTEEEIIEHLLKYENLYELIDSYLKEGYNTLGERIILLKEDEKYIVLEGNRRIAAIKCLFTYKHLLKSIYRERTIDLDINKFNVLCDSVTNRIEANYKIASKHISSIKSWRSIDKYVYYHNMFTHLIINNSIKDSFDYIKQTTPEKLSEIKKDIRNYNFLLMIHSAVKNTNPDIKPLSLLDNDVLTSRVYNALKKDLKLEEKQGISLIVPKHKEDIFSLILTLIGEATWMNRGKESNVLNTRTFQRQSQWHTIVKKDEIIPGLDLLIKKWHEIDFNIGNDSVTPLIIDDKKGDQFNIEEVNEVASTLENNDFIDQPITQTEDINEINKYRLFLDTNFTNNLIIENTKDTDLIHAVLLYDRQNNAIPRKSSEYSNIRFSAPEQQGILIKNSLVLKNSKPLSYDVYATFKDQKVRFKIRIQNSNDLKALNISEVFINDDWLESIVISLEKNHKFEKIVSTFHSLVKQTREYNSSIEKSDILIISFLIRALLEFISKAYFDIIIKSVKQPFPPESLPALIKSVAEDMFSKDPRRFTLENKKSIKSNEDLELLNSIIHDYSTSLSNQDLKRVFKKYRPYFESTVFFITENN